MHKIYTLQKSKTPMTVVHKKQPYVIGFKNISIASRVMYHIDPNQPMQLLPEDPIPMYEPITKAQLMIDSQATLFIPKLQVFGKGGEEEKHPCAVLELEEHDYHDFIVYPATHSVGVIIPYILVMEDHVEYVYTCHSIHMTVW